VDQGVHVSCHAGQVKPGQPDWPGPVDLLVCGQPETDDGDGVGAGTRGFDAEQQGEQFGGGAAIPWSPALRRRRSRAAALAGTRCGGGTGREGENGEVHENQ
jgi:hypothetical protein